MKVSFTFLVFVGCVLSMVNAAKRGILTEAGTYKPGSVAKVWAPVFTLIGKKSDEAGVELVQQFLPLLNEADGALVSGDMAKVAKAFKDCTELVSKILPHIKNANLQKLLDERNQKVESVSQGLATGETNLKDLNAILSVPNNDPITNLLKELSDLIGEIGELVGGLVN